MNKKLYVGNLTANITEEVIRNNFINAGPIAAVTIIKDNYTNRSKGFGFVEMETEEGACKAVEMFNGGNLDGNVIIVNEARPRKDQGGQGQRRDFNRRGGFRSGGGRRY